MISYAPATGLARAALLKPYNSLDVFVEDASCQNMYVRLVNRILGRRGQISSVIPLYGRPNVIDACKKDQAQRARRRIYLIDADLDLINGKPKPRLKHLYRLQVYCSENLVVTERAVVHVAMEGLTNDDLPTVQQKLDVHSLLHDSANALLPLFILYALIHRLNLPIRTVSVSVLSLLSDSRNARSLDRARIRSRIRQILGEVYRHCSRRKYVRSKQAIRKRLSTVSLASSALISGKTYLLPLIHLQLNTVACIRDSRDGLKVRFAQHCEVDVDPGLVRALRRATM